MQFDPFSDFDVFATLEDAAAAAYRSGHVVRAIRCESNGVLVVQKGFGGGLVALPFKGGETQHIAITAIVADGSSGCVPITVFR